MSNYSLKDCTTTPSEEITLEDLYDILDDVWYEVNKLRGTFLIIYFIVLAHFLFFVGFVYHLLVW